MIKDLIKIKVVTMETEQTVTTECPHCGKKSSHTAIIEPILELKNDLTTNVLIIIKKIT